MGRYIGPKNRLSRREGLDLFGKGNKLRRANVPPGQHGPKGSRRPSDYSAQLREKQKTRRLYGIMERQFRKYFETARKVRGATGEVILRLLETRLDNVVYRLGLASTRNQARQLVSHGHVTVNGKVVDIASYQVRPGETISLTAKMANSDAVKARLESSSSNPPSWLSRRGITGVVETFPAREDIDTPVNEQLIVEYYSNR